MKKIEAERQLVDVLVADKEGQFSQWEEVEDLLRNGFQGFGNMTPKELIQCAADADLINRKPEVAALVAVLED